MTKIDLDLRLGGAKSKIDVELRELPEYTEWLELEVCAMYRYAQVESALQYYTKIPDQSRPALKARLKYLQRMGVASNSPGKGSKVDYDLAEVCKWALCLELGNFGMDPSRISSTIDKWWPSLVDKIMDFYGNGNLFLIAVPNALLAGTIDNPNPEDRLLLMPIIPHLGQMLFEIDELELRHLSRLIVINVSLLRRQVEQALLHTKSSS